MKCPICGKAMHMGGIVADGAILVSWYPQEQFEKTGLKSLWYTGGKTVGKSNPFLKSVKVPNAWYCDGCDKVIGVFDVTQDDA